MLMLALGRGMWAVSQKRIMIQLCEDVSLSNLAIYFFQDALSSGVDGFSLTCSHQKLKNKPWKEIGSDIE